MNVKLNASTLCGLGCSSLKAKCMIHASETFTPHMCGVCWKLGTVRATYIDEVEAYVYCDRHAEFYAEHFGPERVTMSRLAVTHAEVTAELKAFTSDLSQAEINEGLLIMTAVTAEASEKGRDSITALTLAAMALVAHGNKVLAARIPAIPVMRDDLKVSMRGDMVTVTISEGYTGTSFKVTGSIMDTRYGYTQAFVNMPTGYGHLSAWYPLSALTKVSAI